ncbi:MAG: hypothetical protein KH454_01465 [Eggerthella sp.]|nr:hypothetical protein [Eggerthella sp.]
MLSPDQLESAGNRVAAIYNDIEAKMLDHLVASMVNDEQFGQRSMTDLALVSQTHTNELRTILDNERANISDAVYETVEEYLRASDNDDVKRLGEGEPVWPHQVEATVAGVALILERDNLQMVEGAKQAFLDSSIKAITRVNTGTMTTERALHSAVRELEGEGIPIITYQNSKTGMVTVRNKVDVAVRRHIRTQIAQDGMRMSMDRLEKLNVQLVEVSSHEDSRPSHREWQGRCYSLLGDIEIEGTKYPDFYSATHYGSVDGLGGANCRHSFGPYRHGAPRAYEPNPKHPSGLPGEEVYELEQKQRYLEREIRKAKRELRGAQQIYDKDQKNLANKSALIKAQDKLKRRQEGMRNLINEANAKCKPGTKVLYRKPNREWAGDMPKSEKVSASGRSLKAFMDQKSVKDSLKKNGITQKELRAGITSEMAKRGGTSKDFSSLSAKDQQGIFRRIVNAFYTPAKVKRAKHAATPQRYEADLSAKGLKADHAREIAEIVAACKDANARKVFDKALPNLMFDEINDSRGRAFYNSTTHGITLNIQNSADGFEHRPDKAAYQTFFHETGHYIDHLLGNFDTGTVVKGRKRFICMDGAAHKAGLASTAKKEAKDTLNNIKNREGCDIAEAKRILTRELRSIDPSKLGGVADIFEGATTSSKTGAAGWGHGRKYWSESGDYGLATETFAHFYETTMANPEALQTLKKYFPASYNVFTSIIGAV